MPDTPDPSTPFRKLQQSIGSLMFIWCRLEDVLANALEARGEPLDGSFRDQFMVLEAIIAHSLRPDAARLHDFTTLAERINSVRRTRNLIVHGLAGFSAEPGKGEPYITYRIGESTRSQARRLTQTGLNTLIEAIDHCRRDLEAVDHLTR